MSSKFKGGFVERLMRLYVETMAIAVGCLRYDGSVKTFRELSIKASTNVVNETENVY